MKIVLLVILGFTIILAGVDYLAKRPPEVRTLFLNRPDGTDGWTLPPGSRRIIIHQAEGIVITGNTFYTIEGSDANVLKPEQVFIDYEYGQMWVRDNQGKLIFSYTQDWKGYPLLEIYGIANIIDVRVEIPKGFKRIGNFTGDNP